MDSKCRFRFTTRFMHGDFYEFKCDIDHWHRAENSFSSGYAFIDIGEFWSGKPVPQCCCAWGAAVGRRGREPAQEFPEFDCADCPKHGGEQDEHRCKRHKKLHESRVS